MELFRQQADTNRPEPADHELVRSNLVKVTECSSNDALVSLCSFSWCLLSLWHALVFVVWR